MPGSVVGVDVPSCLRMLAQNILITCSEEFFDSAETGKDGHRDRSFHGLGPSTTCKLVTTCWVVVLVSLCWDVAQPDLLECAQSAMLF